MGSNWGNIDLIGTDEADDCEDCGDTADDVVLLLVLILLGLCEGNTRFDLGGRLQLRGDRGAMWSGDAFVAAGDLFRASGDLDGGGGKA